MVMKPFLKEHVWLFLLFAWLLAVMCKVQTYVSAQDPGFYMHLGRMLLDNPPGSPAFREALFRVAPGFPLILAAVRTIGGPFVPYWINLGFAGLFFAGLASVTRRCLTRHADDGVVVYTTAIVMFMGYGLNTHFLLYLFRGMPAYAFAMMGFWVLVRWRGSIPAAGLAGCFLMAAIGVREPMVFAWLGAAAWIVTNRTSRSWRPLVAFVAPLLSALLLLKALLGQGASSQAANVFSWLDRIPLGARLLEGVPSQVMLVGDELSWWGSGLVLTGLWTGRRNRSLWCLFLMPALGLLLFYACLPVHRRYILSLLVFLGPIAGLGLYTLVVRVRWRWAQSLALTLLCIPLLVHLVRVQPWGPAVSRAEVLQFVSDLQAIVRPGDGVVLEPACRHAADALVSFSDANQLVAIEEVTAWLEAGKTAFYLKPLSERALYKRPGRVHLRFNVVSDVSAHYNVTRIHAEQPLRLADGEFDLYGITPWDRSLVRNDIQVTDSGSSAVWLDFRSADPLASTTVRIRSDGSESVQEWKPVKAQGLVLLGLGERSSEQTNLQVEMESTALLPDVVVDHVFPAGEESLFRAGHGLSSSVRDWFTSDMSQQTLDDYSIAFFDRNLEVHLPTLLGESGDWVMHLQLSVTQPFSEPSIITTDVAGRPLQTCSVAPDAGRFWNSFIVPLSNSADTPAVRIRVVDDLPGVLRIHAVRFTMGVIDSDS